MTERSIRASTCRHCAHSPDLHGARAGTPPGACLRPGCLCVGFEPVEPGARVPDPRHDRDLYLAYTAAVDLIESNRDGCVNDAYELLMAEVARWFGRVTVPRVAPLDRAR